MKQTTIDSSSSRPVTLITGYRGLAEALIRRFEPHHSVSVLVRKESAVSELRKKFPRIHLFVGDVDVRRDCERWIESVKRDLGRIDALINNAAIQGPAGRLHEIDFADLETTFRTDFLAPLYLCQRVLPHFLEQGNGVIINVSGGGATTARPRFIPYASAKCALVRATESLALEYPELSFYAVSPGGMKTAMTEAVVKMGADRAGAEYEVARQRIADGGDDPSKAADLSLWLVENRPKSLSGKLISAIWDDYRPVLDQALPSDWWTLRRVDSKLSDSLADKP